jgi:hypothetical protein
VFTPHTLGYSPSMDSHRPSRWRRVRLGLVGRRSYLWFACGVAVYGMTPDLPLWPWMPIKFLGLALAYFLYSAMARHAYRCGAMKGRMDTLTAYMEASSRGMLVTDWVEGVVEQVGHDAKAAGLADKVIAIRAVTDEHGRCPDCQHDPHMATACTGHLYDDSACPCQTNAIVKTVIE